MRHIPTCIPNLQQYLYEEPHISEDREISIRYGFSEKSIKSKHLAKTYFNFYLYQPFCYQIESQFWLTRSQNT